MIKNNNDFKKWSKNDFIKYQKKVLKNDNNCSILSQINFDYFDLNKNGLIKNIPFAIKDNYAIRAHITTSGSIIMSDFKPNYSATVFKKLIKAGGVPLFKTNMDELGMGSSGLTSSFGKVLNPFNSERIIGGSSSGSAYVVSKNIVTFAIGSDTGDSVRKPAVYANIVGFKPTWGIVSRYGLFDFAPTWDTVGWFTKDVSLSAKLLDILQGYDPKDATSIEPKDKDYLKDLKTTEKFKLGIIKPFLRDIVDNEIIVEYEKALEKLKKKGHKIIELELNLEIFRAVLITYRVISSSEALSCNGNLTGFLFGKHFGNRGAFEERITNSRTKGFNYEVKRRFLFAAEAMLNNEEVYHKSRQIRTLIIKELEKAFSKVDALVMPAHSMFSPKINKDGEFLKYESFMDNYLVLFNANGSPSITVPIKNNNENSVAVNIATKPFQDKKCLQIAKIVEEL